MKVRLEPRTENTRRVATNALRITAVIGAIVVLPLEGIGGEPGAKGTAPSAMVGAYYFEGWAGRSALADDPSQPWARNAPTHLTRRMLEEFPEREPIWGWRDDALDIMERQIDLAADHGLAFFAFCWYWHDNGRAINPQGIHEDPKHICLDLYLKARNRDRLKFCLLVANHAGFEIKGADNWKQAVEFWMPYLKHPQHVRVGGKPLVILFHPGDGDREALTAMQEAARQAGLPGLAIAGCGGGSVETGYTHRTHYNIVPGYAAGAERHSYAELVAANRAAWGGRPEQPYIPIVTAGWDKRPWEGPQGLNQPAGSYYPDRTPAQFADFLRGALAWMDQHPDQATAERLVLIYAWNEFGEGGYVAPTKGDPDGNYLEALRSVVRPANQPGQAVTPAAATFGERLGWKPDQVVVLLHVDDVGMSHSSNQGGIEAVEQGVATSWSVMMPCPWVPEISQYLRTNPGIDSGVHLTLTSEWTRYRWGPLAGKPQVPGLVDGEGCLWKSVAEVAAHATADEVERELRAQLERAEALGHPITHLDSHMGTLFARTDFFERFAQLGIEKRIPILAVGGHMTYALEEHGTVARALQGMAPKIWNAGLPVIDDLHSSSLSWKPAEKSDRLIELLGGLKPGVTEIIFHASKPTEEFPLITGTSESRRGDLRALTDPKVRRFIQDRGIVLTTWRELMERRQNAGPME
jgi:predicted glycoside hydrolase/deacetylase ChbG (UPF0249 family)